jgi:hypothetical protein
LWPSGGRESGCRERPTNFDCALLFAQLSTFAQIMVISVQSPLRSILQARLIVGFLGERAQFGWWPTAFYETSSRLFLEPIFSRTPHVAQYHGVVEAARRLHDEHLSVGTYHLFRLPEEMEQDLHSLMQSGFDEPIYPVICQYKQTSFEALNLIAGSATKSGAGPTSIGNVSDIGNSLAEIASVYRSAFASDCRAFPYLLR